jgi:hypothetical protein
MTRSHSLLVGIMAIGLLFTFSRALAQRSASATPAAALGSAFTYQGQLRDGAATANGSYDLTFRLYDALDGGAQIGSAVALSGVLIQDGLFTVQLDFGPSAFQGDRRYLEVQVGATVLSPRQALTAAPYALHAASVPWSGISGVPADLADGDDGGQPSPYANVVIVAKSGGDFTSVQAALDSITTASAANPFLVYVAPGVYVEQVTLKPYVTLEGSGQGATIVRWTGGSSASSHSERATMIGASNATVRRLSIESVAQAGAYPLGFYNMSSSPVISEVSITAINGSSTYGMYNEASSPTLTNVSITATQSASYNTGMHNVASSPTLTNVKVIANGPTGVASKDYALDNFSASAPIIKDSLLSGRIWSISVTNSTAKVVNSQLIGNVGAGLSCFNTYNANFGAVTCP